MPLPSVMKLTFSIFVSKHVIHVSYNPWRRDGTYDKLVRDMIEQKGSRLVVSINDLRNSNPERAKALLNKSFEEVSAFQRALKEFVGSIDATFAKETTDFFVGLEGSFGSKHVTPRY